MESRVVIILQRPEGGLASSHTLGGREARCPLAACHCPIEFRQHFSRTGNCLLVGVELHKVNDSAGLLALNDVVPERLGACVVQHISSVAAQLDVSRLWMVGIRQ